MTTNDTMIAQLLKHLIAEGPQAMRHAMTTLMNTPMRPQREHFLAAGHDECDPARRGYATFNYPYFVFKSIWRPCRKT
jgi:hypothetical protein